MFSNIFLCEFEIHVFTDNQVIHILPRSNLSKIKINNYKKITRKFAVKEKLASIAICMI